MLNTITRRLSQANNAWKRKREAVQNLIVCLSPYKPISVEAFESACEIASSHSEAHVSALHVPDSSSCSTAIYSELIDQVGNDNKATLDVVPSSSVKMTIVDQLEKKHPDLCVIGAYGSHFCRDLFSTVHFVTKNAPCDVLVVRQDGLWQNGPMKAVVCFGINDWEGSIDAFKAAVRIARPGDEIEAVHVVHSYNSVDAVFGPPMMPPKGNGTIEEKIAKSLEAVMLQTLNDKASCLRPDQVTLKSVILFAGVENPTKVIADYAANHRINLVSVGVGSIARIFCSANFSYYLTHNSPCSVLVARGTLQSEPPPITVMKDKVQESADFYVDDPQEWFLRKSSI